MSGARRRINPPAARNEALRAHVTRVGFDLSLGRTHVAALVYLNESIDRGGYISTNKAVGPLARSFSYFASGMHGCEDRGLVIHHYDATHRGDGLGHHFTITRAGRLVVDLLRESGLYAEYVDALPALEAVS